ncbi:hypothetical protein QEH59_11740 [Coraliomargarita sp. SDUM461004]|uniref:HNH endonuclease n=1 Tax=Thalassobacterium sedimentorum TaxID=3041258 RepID=A0ABU1AJV4_9BACT|nr:hypothetical protein [Coraliomargarita sp. SDUM461004]
MPKKYKSAISRQTARQIKRNRKQNIPRLNKLKECIGCMACGKCDVPGHYLDGHHIDESRKYQPLARLVNRRWLRLIREIFGIDRDQPGGGGPIEFVCQRYHEERHQIGEDAKCCVELEKEGFLEPWRIHSRNPRRKNS